MRFRLILFLLLPAAALLFSVDPKPYATQPFDLPSMTITAIQEELGLRLESRKFELQVMVIDQIEAPNEN